MIIIGVKVNHFVRVSPIDSFTVLVSTKVRHEI